MIVYFLIAVSVLLILVSSAKHNRIKNPLNLIIIWWTIWLLIAITYDVDYIEPSQSVVLLVVLYIFVMTVGYMSYKGGINNIYKQYVYDDVQKETRLFINKLYIIAILIYLIPLSRGINYWISNGIMGYRDVAVFGNDGVSVVYIVY